MSLGDKEAPNLVNPLKFAERLTEWAWEWKKLDGWQEEVMTSQERYMILNCSRQSGKSSILMVKAFHKALTTENALILIIAEQRQSNEDLRKIRELQAAYSKYLKKTYGGKLVLSLKTDNVTSLEFANGSRIIALPANEKVRGFSAPTMVILDEAARLRDEVFVAVDPMLEVSNGQLILASTPEGTSGFFHREWDNPRYQKAKFEVPWQFCPRIKQESIEEKRILYGEAFIAQEYECRFLDELTALFTETALQQSIDAGEDVFSEEMANINKIVHGEVELI